MDTGDIYFIKREFSKNFYEIEKQGGSIRFKEHSLIDQVSREYITSLHNKAVELGYECSAKEAWERLKAFTDALDKQREVERLAAELKREEECLEQAKSLSPVELEEKIHKWHFQTFAAGTPNNAIDVDREHRDIKDELYWQWTNKIIAASQARIKAQEAAAEREKKKPLNRLVRRIKIWRNRKYLAYLSEQGMQPPLWW